MDSKVRLLISSLGENRVKVDTDLSDYLQTGLGGPAKAFYIATTPRELIKSVELCRQLKIPYLLIGSGSKVAISSQGFKGLVVKNRADSLKVFGIKGKVSRSGIGIEEAMVEAESGATLSKLADFAAQQGLSGLEVVRTLPGTVGGSFYILTILRDKSSQIKVLTQTGSQRVKDSRQLLKEDIILSAVFKLKSKKV